MKAFYNNSFKGFNPVGVSSVIICKDLNEAKKLLKKQLIKNGISQSCDDYLKNENFIEIDLENSKAIILNDGDY